MQRLVPAELARMEVKQGVAEWILPVECAGCHIHAFRPAGEPEVMRLLPG